MRVIRRMSSAISRSFWRCFSARIWMDADVRASRFARMTMTSAATATFEAFRVRVALRYLGEGIPDGFGHVDRGGGVLHEALLRSHPVGALAFVELLPAVRLGLLVIELALGHELAGEDRPGERG